MKRNNKAKIIVLVLIGVLAFFCVLGKNGEKQEQFQLFENNSEGYSLLLEKEYEITTSVNDVVTVLEKEDTIIEIYKYKIVEDGNVYVNYCNRFLENTEDHYLDYKDIWNVNSRDVHVAKWHRDTLSKISNDKNYYISFDIVGEGELCSIFIKSAADLGNVEDYRYMVESVKLFEPAKTMDSWKSKPVNLEERGWNQETKEFYQQYFSEEANLSWGIFEPDAAGLNFETLDYYEKKLEYVFPILLTYTQIDITGKSLSMLEPRLQHNWEHGKVTELTLQTVTVEDGNMMYNILNGEYDEFLFLYATTIAEFQHPVLFRPFNEMNGDWCPYSSYNTSKDTIIYREVYKYVYEIFENAGVNNAIWVWNPNESSFPKGDWNHMLMYYPGDEYVDVIGLTAYNTGTYYAEVGESWKEFSELYDDVYEQYCKLFSQPFMITEFSCAIEGGDKVAWVKDMFDNIGKYERIKIAVWWNYTDFNPNTGEISRNYRIDEPEEILDVFYENFHKNSM